MRKQELIADIQKGTARKERTRKDGIQMKKVLMMIQESCPYCRQALRMMDELKAERPEFQAVEVKIVDENREKAFADSLDYWYVPTYFVDGVKVHEGANSLHSLSPSPENVHHTLRTTVSALIAQSTYSFLFT